MTGTLWGAGSRSVPNATVDHLDPVTRLAYLAWLLTQQLSRVTFPISVASPDIPPSCSMPDYNA